MLLKEKPAPVFRLTWTTPTGKECAVQSHEASKIKQQMTAMLARGIIAQCTKDGNYCGAVRRLYANGLMNFDADFEGERLQHGNL